MSNQRALHMTDRQREILRIALELIADEGYSGLSMRGLARSCGMKLGALQYHFRTWEDMLRGIVKYIAFEFSSRLKAQKDVGSYLMGYHNRQRPHAFNGGISPVAAEENHKILSGIS